MTTLLRCEYCGKLKEDVSKCIDPYLLEIEGEEVIRNLCDDCYEFLCDEI